MVRDRAPTPAVDDAHVSASTPVAQLVDAFRAGGGFTSRRVAQGVDALRAMRDDGSTVLLSFPAAPVATGLRGVLVDLVARGPVAGIITTSGTLDHDLARTWGTYHHGDFDLDDVVLHDQGMHRLGNVLVPAESYGVMLETRLRPFFSEYFAEQPQRSTSELCRALGQLLDDDPRRHESLLWTAYARNVPVFVPGPTDGAVGSQVWMAYQENRSIVLDLMSDEQQLSSLVMDADRLGALIIGGGISKHHLIWWAQFRDGLDAAVAVTTATEYDGSLSGARLHEAISWGKLKEKATHVTIDGDATVILPLLASAWLD